MLMKILLSSVLYNLLLKIGEESPNKIKLRVNARWTFIQADNTQRIALFLSGKFVNKIVGLVMKTCAFGAHIVTRFAEFYVLLETDLIRKRFDTCVLGMKTCLLTQTH